MQLDAPDERRLTYTVARSHLRDQPPLLVQASQQLAAHVDSEHARVVVGVVENSPRLVDPEVVRARAEKVEPRGHERRREIGDCPMIGSGYSTGRL